LREKFLILIDSDTECYNKIIAARRLAKSIEAEKTNAGDNVQDAYKDAVKPPFELLQNSLSALLLASSISHFYYTRAASDLGIAANCLLTAARGAYLTILTNTDSINDGVFNEYHITKSKSILSEAEKIAGEIYSAVEKLLS
jgi:formiminotetrahydrofolate cyclodeaminase